MSAAEMAYVRTRAGKIHSVAIVNGRPRVDERCNLDDAPGVEEVIAAIPEDVDEDAFCGHCFKRPEDPS